MPSRETLSEFVAWTPKHITGDEKGQAQIFLDRLFLSFGQSGCLDVSGATEFRICKADEDGGGTAFADYVWKPVVLIEMKKRGENLQKHYSQALITGRASCRTFGFLSPSANRQAARDRSRAALRTGRLRP